jgi:hypothetical protein
MAVVRLAGGVTAEGVTDIQLRLADRAAPILAVRFSVDSVWATLFDFVVNIV